MPYVSPARRKLLNDPTLSTHRSGTSRPLNVGELTYVLTRELNAYLSDKVERGNGLRYADCAEVLAALAGARADFERRVLSELEVRAQERNGDVWSDEVLLALRDR